MNNTNSFRECMKVDSETMPDLNNVSKSYSAKKVLPPQGILLVDVKKA